MITRRMLDNSCETSIQAGHCRKLLDFDREAFAVTIEFRRVHALDVGNPGLILAPQLNARRVLKNIRLLGKVVDEEVARRIARRFVVTESVLILDVADSVWQRRRRECGALTHQG